MYHFTSFDSFLKIWAGKTLKLSPQSGLNDMNEVSKFYWREYNSYNTTKAEDSLEELRKEVEKYKQLSFVKETDDLKNPFKSIPSCMNPVMWGHYGDSGKGVCIRIDISKIKFPKNIFRRNVMYKKDITPPALNRLDIPKFVTSNRKSFFFTKTRDWSYEKEYRVVSKEEEYLDIHNAISEVIITSLFGLTDSFKDNGGIRSTLYNSVLEPMIPNKINILEFCSNGINGPSLIDRSGKLVFPKIDLKNFTVDLSN